MSLEVIWGPTLSLNTIANHTKQCYCSRNILTLLPLITIRACSKDRVQTSAPRASKAVSMSWGSKKFWASKTYQYQKSNVRNMWCMKSSDTLITWDFWGPAFPFTLGLFYIKLRNILQLFIVHLTSMSLDLNLGTSRCTLKHSRKSIESRITLSLVVPITRSFLPCRKFNTPSMIRTHDIDSIFTIHS